MSDQGAEITMYLTLDIWPDLQGVDHRLQLIQDLQRAFM